MPTKTYTETQCQGCGKVQRREGTPDGPPPAWMQGHLTIYGEDNAIRQHVWVGELCVSCGDKVLAALGVKRKRERRATAPEQPLFPDTHEQPQVELGEVDVHHPALPGLPETVKMPVATTGDDLQAPQATDAEQASGTARTPEQKADLQSLVGITSFPSRKPGWQKGLSRTLRPCPQSAIPHRHRVDDPSKPTELTCVGIQYPAKAAAS